MAKEGILLVTSKILDPTQTTDEQYQRFYHEEHLPSVANFMKKADFPLLALRFRNTNPERNRRHLALYPVPDVEKTVTWLKRIFFEGSQHSSSLGGHIFEHLSAELLGYEKIQTFEGYGHADKTGSERGKTLVFVAMEPGPTSEQERDFDDWYRKQHLDMLSMCRGYRRTTRYKRIDGEKPRYLALHEYDCEAGDLPSEQIAQVVATEWTQKILGEVETYDRDVFELFEVHGEAGMKL